MHVPTTIHGIFNRDQINSSLQENNFGSYAWDVFKSVPCASSQQFEIIPKFKRFKTD